MSTLNPLQWDPSLIAPPPPRCVDFPPPTPSESAAPKRPFVQVDPLKKKIHDIQKEMLSKVFYDLTKNPLLRSKIPVDYKDILRLDEIKNILALGDIHAKLSRTEFNNLQNLAATLKENQEKFDQAWKKAETAIKRFPKDHLERLKAVKAVINVEIHMKTINKDVEAIKEQINELRSHADSQQKSVELRGDVELKKAHPKEGKKWYVDVKTLYHQEMHEKKHYMLDYQKQVEKAQSGKIKLSKLELFKKEAYFQKLQVKIPSFVEWACDNFDKLDPDDNSKRALIIKEAVLMLGGTKHFAENLGDYEKKMLTEQERL